MRFDGVKQDLRYALRTARRTPVLSAVIVISLALGIGANTAIFSTIDALMLRPLPVPHPEQLVMFRVDDGNPKADIWYYAGASYPRFAGMRARTSVFADMAAITLLDRSGVRLAGSATVDPRQVRVALVSGSYFNTFGVHAARGRVFTTGDDRVPDGSPLAVISDAYWTAEFARAPNVVGRVFDLGGTKYTILGVTPPDFTGDWVGRPTDIWIPMMMQSEVMREMPGLLTRPNGFVRIVARLEPGVSMTQAQAAARATWRQMILEDLGPGATPEHTRMALSDQLSLVSAAHGYSSERATFSQSLAILMAIVAIVLLIACANVANLLLARATARSREMALRASLGASRARLVQQLLIEGLLLGLLGAAGGLALSAWSTRALSTVTLAPVQLDSRAASAWTTFDLRPDLRVLAFTAALGLVATTLFAVASVLRGSRVRLSETLSVRGVSAGRPGRWSLGRILVVVQVALSFVLVIGAGLFVRTLRNLKLVDLGLDRGHVILAWTSPGQTGRAGDDLARLVRAAIQRLSEAPGVVAVGASNGGLLMGAIGGLQSEALRIQGLPPKAGQHVAKTAVTPGYFAALGLTLVAGRDFTEADTAGAQRVEVVNETFARFFFGSENPIGRRYAATSSDQGFPIEIVGVVKATKNGSPRDRGQAWTYAPYRQGIGLMRNTQFQVRVRGSLVRMATLVRRELQRLEPTLPVLRIDTIDEQVNDVLAPERLTAAMSTACGALAVLMACLGLYGVIAYGVARRFNEIGIRMALGATRSAVLRMIVTDSLLLVAIGIAVGLPAALAGARFIASRLYGVGTTDPFTLLGATALTLVVTFIAGCLPARRATHVDPVIALRAE